MISNLGDQKVYLEEAGTWILWEYYTHHFLVVPLNSLLLLDFHITYLDLRIFDDISMIGKSAKHLFSQMLAFHGESHGRIRKKSP